MSVKDKVIFGLLALLLVGGAYFQWMSDDMKSRMDTLNQNDKDHLDTIDREFREDLRKLNIGQQITFLNNKLGITELIKFELNFDTDLIVDLRKKIEVNKISLKKNIEKHSKEFVILESLYLDGIKNEVPVIF